MTIVIENYTKQVHADIIAAVAEMQREGRHVANLYFNQPLQDPLKVIIRLEAGGFNRLVFRAREALQPNNKKPNLILNKEN